MIVVNKMKLIQSATIQFLQAKCQNRNINIYLKYMDSLFYGYHFKNPNEKENVKGMYFSEYKTVLNEINSCKILKCPCKPLILKSTDELL